MDLYIFHINSKEYKLLLIKILIKIELNIFLFLIS